MVSGHSGRGGGGRFVGYHPHGLRLLRAAVEQARDELGSVRSLDPWAADAEHVRRGAVQLLDEVAARITRVLDDDALTGGWAMRPPAGSALAWQVWDAVRSTVWGAADDPRRSTDGTRRAAALGSLLAAREPAAWAAVTDHELADHARAVHALLADPDAATVFLLALGAHGLAGLLAELHRRLLPEVVAWVDAGGEPPDAHPAAVLAAGLGRLAFDDEQRSAGHGWVWDTVVGSAPLVAALAAMAAALPSAHRGSLAAALVARAADAPRAGEVEARAVHEVVAGILVTDPVAANRYLVGLRGQARLSVFGPGSDLAALLTAATAVTLPSSLVGDLVPSLFDLRADLVGAAAPALLDDAFMVRLVTPWAVQVQPLLADRWDWGVRTPLAAFAALLGSGAGRAAMHAALPSWYAGWLATGGDAAAGAWTVGALSEVAVAEAHDDEERRRLVWDHAWGALDAAGSAAVAVATGGLGVVGETVVGAVTGAVPSTALRPLVEQRGWFAAPPPREQARLAEALHRADTGEAVMAVAASMAVHGLVRRGVLPAGTPPPPPSRCDAGGCDPTGYRRVIAAYVDGLGLPPTTAAEVRDMLDRAVGDAAAGYLDGSHPRSVTAALGA